MSTSQIVSVKGLNWNVEPLPRRSQFRNGEFNLNEEESEDSNQRGLNSELQSDSEDSSGFGFTNEMPMNLDLFAAQIQRPSSKSQELLNFEAIQDNDAEERSNSSLQQLSEDSGEFGSENMGVDTSLIKILLVDDQVFNLILLENLISESFPNAVMETALNGKLALDRVKEADAEKSPFELIFMDINMPEMDGIEASSLIVQSFNEGTLLAKPFIAAITAYTSEETKRQTLSKGMERFLTKPAQANIVNGLIKEVLSRRNQIVAH